MNFDPVIVMVMISVVAGALVGDIWEIVGVGLRLGVEIVFIVFVVVFVLLVLVAGLIVGHGKPVVALNESPATHPVFVFVLFVSGIAVPP